MQRAFHVLAILGVLASIVVMVVLLFWLGSGRRQASAMRNGSDVRLVAAVTPASRSAWLGLTLQPITDVMRKQLGLPRTGVVVSDIASGSPAAQAGLKVGDVLRKVAGQTIRQPKDLDVALSEVKAGQRIRMNVWRQGQASNLDVAAAVPPPVVPKEPAPLPEAEVEIEIAWLGLDIVTVSPAEAAEAGVEAGVRGMLVDDIAAGRGKDAGLTTGDIILAINGKPTRSIKEFQEATKDAVGALVDVVRNGRHLYASIPPPGTTPQERLFMQQRLPLTKVNWDVPLAMGQTAPTWPQAGMRPREDLLWYGPQAGVPMAVAPVAPPGPTQPGVRPANWDAWWLRPGWQAQASFGWQRVMPWQTLPQAAPAAPQMQTPAQLSAPRPANWDVPVVPALPAYGTAFGPVLGEDWRRGVLPGRVEDRRARGVEDRLRFGPEIEFQRAVPMGAFAAGGL
jgi:hypothetical protein